jgi:magnesium-transporting ATPase (P-type)
MMPEHWDDLALGDSAAPILSTLTRYYEKSVLYAGTRLIRVRREIPQDQEEQHILQKKKLEERQRMKEKEEDVENSGMINEKFINCENCGMNLKCHHHSCVHTDQKCDVVDQPCDEQPSDCKNGQFHHCNTCNSNYQDGEDGSSCRVTFAIPGEVYRVKAIVLRTGFNTTKGNLIRTILFPRPTQFKFYRDSIRFVGILGGVALLGFTYSILQLVILGQSLFHIITKACDMITIVVPPALPASMSVGANFSLLRLKQKRIYCISPSRINVAGKVNLVCFDKTGTLTEDSLDLLGIHTASEGQSVPIIENALVTDSTMQVPLSEEVRSCVLSSPESETSGAEETMPLNAAGSSGFTVGPLLYATPKGSNYSDRHGDDNFMFAFERQRAKQQLYPDSDADYVTLMFMAMGSCHTLKRVQEELVGDPLDMKMFRLTGLHLEEGILLAGGGNQATTSINRPPIAKSALGPSPVMPMVDLNDYPAAVSSSSEDTKLALKIDTGHYVKPDLPAQFALPSASSAKTVHASSVLIKFGIQEKGGGECLRIIKAFEFYPELRRQSVVVKHYGAAVSKINGKSDAHGKGTDASRLFVFVKGSPEELKELCVALPDNYDALLDHYTFRGYRVLAVAFKRLKSGESYEQRDAVERDLNFLGFLVFENRLKNATIPSLKVLKEDARLRTLMCTGDNILTAISVAKQCAMVPSEATVFVPFLIKPDDAKLAPQQNNAHGKDKKTEKDDQKSIVSSSASSAHGEHHIRWCSTLDAHHILSCTALTPIYKATFATNSKSGGNGRCDEIIDGLGDENFDAASDGVYDQGTDQHSDQIIDGPADQSYDYLPFPQGQPYTLACTGRVLEYLIDCCDVSVLQRVLLTCSIYARLSPSQKQRLVECLQRLDYVVAFCGDGANDCGALKASDIGVSLSEAEASVAAPFTCARPDISCMVDLLREGRSSLVTSFSVFKYMALYSLIQFNSVLLLYHFGSNLGDAQFAYVDLVIIIPLAVSMNRLEATSTNLHYATPTASLVSRRHLASLLTQLLICLAFQYLLVGALVSRPWYTPVSFSPASDNIPWHLNTVLFSFSTFQYVLVALVFTSNAPHQRPIYTNAPFMAIASVVTAWNLLFLIYPTPAVAILMELVPLPLSFRLFILVCILLHTALSLWADRAALLLLKRIRTLAASCHLQQPALPKPSSKLYKKLLAEMTPDPLRL